MITAIQPTQQPKRNNGKLALSTAAGAVAGAAARYAIPTKTEIKNIVNKDAIDTFVSNNATQARGAGRSVLKYAGAGALVAAGLNLLSRIFPDKNAYEKANSEYTKFGALVDAPDYAVEIMWYGEPDDETGV